MKNDCHVIWITGLSGAGKTTVASRVTEMLRAEGASVFWFDGDVMRDTLGNKWGYSQAERHELAWVYAKLIHLMAKSGQTVVCSVVALFDDIRAWNREQNSNYFEVFLDVPVAQLIERDSKGLYKKYKDQGIAESVMSNTQEMPKVPDLTILNYGFHTAEQAANEIFIKYQEKVMHYANKQA